MTPGNIPRDATPEDAAELDIYGQGIGGAGDVEVSTEDIRGEAAGLRELAEHARTAKEHARLAAEELTSTSSLSRLGAYALDQAWLVVAEAEDKAVQLEELARSLDATAQTYEDVEAAAAETIWNVQRPPRWLIALYPGQWIVAAMLAAGNDAMQHGMPSWAFTRAGIGMVLEESIWAMTGIDNGIPNVALALARIIAGFGINNNVTIEEVDAYGNPVGPDYLAPTQAPITDLEGTVDAIAELYPDRGSLNPGTIRIDEIVNADGESSWLVIVPGTQGDLSSDNPFDWSQNPAAMVGLPTAASVMVTQAMAAAGIKPGDSVAIAGHSQGGLVAVNAANAVADQYNIDSVLTVGSPTGLLEAPEGSEVLSLEHEEDPTPGLENIPNEVSDQWTTVSRDLCTSDYGDAAQASDWRDAHDIPNYADTAALVDASDDPAVLDFLASMEEVLDEGGTATSQYFQGARG